MGKYEVQVVNCYYLNVRTGPSTSFHIVHVISRGQKFTSSKQKSGWYWLDSKGGYSSGKYMKVTKNLGSGSSKKPAKKKVKKKKAKPAVKAGFVWSGSDPYTIPTINGSTIRNDTNPYYGILPNGPGAKHDVNPHAIILDNGPKPVKDAPVISLQNGPAPVKNSTATGVLQDGPTPKVNYESPGIAGSFNSSDQETGIYSYEIDTSAMADDLDIMKDNYNISQPSINSFFTRFNRFKAPYSDFQLAKTFSHVFFTRPSLNLYDGGSLSSQFNKDPLYVYLQENNSLLLQSLTENFSSSHFFNPYLYNMASSFEVPDETITTIEHGETYTGYKIMYGHDNIAANTAGQFSIQYKDDSNFSIYKMHKAWIEYIARMYRGKASPLRDNIVKKILDYACSVYYFVCAEDGETVLFWAKYFGVFPINTPASATSWSKSSNSAPSDFSINYAYSIKEDFNPLSLADFNLCCKDDFYYKSVFEPSLGSTGTSMSGAPFVGSFKNDRGETVFKLKFRG